MMSSAFSQVRYLLATGSHLCVQNYTAASVKEHCLSMQIACKRIVPLWCLAALTAPCTAKTAQKRNLHVRTSIILLFLFRLFFFPQERTKLAQELLRWLLSITTANLPSALFEALFCELLGLALDQLLLIPQQCSCCLIFVMF